MVSSFFLTIVLVFIVLGLVYMNLFILSHESQVFEGTQPFEIGSDAKAKIIESDYCFAGKITGDDLLDTERFEECAKQIKLYSDDKILGFSVERMQHLERNTSR